MQPRTESVLSRRTLRHVAVEDATEDATADVEVKTNSTSDNVFVKLIFQGLTPGVRAVKVVSLSQLVREHLPLK